ncbi:MAG TPA: DOMON-like domain-containing protein [Caulobacteraceae bacterium]
MRRVMVIHPSFRAPAVERIEAEAWRPAPRRLALRFVLIGDIDALFVPAAAAPARVDGLWRRTCFEAFVATGPGEGYFEFNVSPSGQWSAYAFSAYRAGMTPAEIGEPPHTEVVAAPGRLEARVSLDLAWLVPPDAPWRLGLSAVIEAADGALSYWALAHPPGRPDFHHSAGFALDLPLTEHPCNSASTA